MQTKLTENINVASELTEIKGYFLAEKLCRRWEEDYTDEDTGEVVSIERSEHLFSKGTLIDDDVLTQINFMLQSGDVKEVLVSDQRRPGEQKDSDYVIWQVQAKYGSKKKTCLLYANSISMALKVAEDYFEQTIEDSFAFVNCKELGFDILIPSDEDCEDDFYKMEMQFLDDYEQKFENTYVLQAVDVEEAKETIITYIASNPESRIQQPFETTTISAKTVVCNGIIPQEFSKEYFEEK